MSSIQRMTVAAYLYLVLAVAGAITAAYGIYRSASEATDANQLQILFTIVVVGFGCVAAIANAMSRRHSERASRSGLGFLLVIGGVSTIAFAAWGGYLRGNTSTGRLVQALICGVGATAMMAALDALTGELVAEPDRSKASAT